MVWHAGEIELQRLVGSDEQLARVGPRVIRPFMPEQHRELFEALPFFVLGGLDAQARPWASVRAGSPGFLRAPDDIHLAFEQTPDPTDPLDLQVGDPVGILGIQPHTRRRNRANGHVVGVEASCTTIRVTQSFGNCPKYITRREARFEPQRASGLRVEVLEALDDEARRLISRADTFYVASSFEGDVDVSHRGGPPGFVEVEDGVLRIPDYAGNRFFNTLGNLVLNPVAGLLFLDFDRAHALHLSGHVTLELRASDHAERQWSFTPRSILWRRHAVPLQWRQSAP